jgi:glycosyltransferase involved in cell wall biosynthesis
MRIVYVVHKLPPESVGGTEIHAWSLARAMAARGHQVWMFAPSRGASSTIPDPPVDGLHVWRVEMPPIAQSPACALWQSVRNRTIEREFTRLLRLAQPDLVHYQHLQGVSLKLVHQARHLPRVLSLHDYWYVCPNGQFVLPARSLCAKGASPPRCARCALSRAGMPSGPVARWLAAAAMAWRNAYVRRQTRGLDLYAAPSASASRAYVDRGWDPERLRVVELGLDLARIQGVATGPRGPHPLHVGYLGAIAWQKGLHILIRAFSRLPADARLTIYGDESAFPAYSRELRALADHGGIRFLGALDPNDVGRALRELDYLVVPSLWSETFGMVVQEAQAVGTPPIVSRVGALERVRDGIDGRVFTPGDVDDLARVLRDVYDHPQQRPALSANLTPGATVAEQAAVWAEIYEGLIARHGATRSNDAAR